MDDEDEMLTADGELHTRHRRRGVSTHEENQRTRSKQQDEHEERTKGKQGRAHTTTTTSKILGMADRNPRSKTLSDSGWIKMSATMDSGAAVTAAHTGRECVAHRRSTRPPLVVWQATTVEHFGEASASYLHCLSRLVGISGFHRGGVVLLGPCAQHDVIMRANHARTAKALVNLIHLDTASELLNHLDEALAEAQHVWRHVRDGIEPPAPQADASLLPRPGRRLTQSGWRW